MSVDCPSLESIGTSAFEGCSNLQSVMIYNNCTNIGENAFKGCFSTTIYCTFSAQPETWHPNWNPDNLKVVWMEPIRTWDISATADDSVIANLYNDHLDLEGY